MKDNLLMQLADRWDRDAKDPEAMDGSDEAKERNAYEHGMRYAKRECANTVRELIRLIGD
ncbi:hypothetical protein [Thermomonas fusca]|uniref:hypothetical protein n=1 Tax=Thermomonas fusca TaxID=215690 RepID=UPI00040C98D5|nr:hypothetical protein [Thermomonas fusca]